MVFCVEFDGAFVEAVANMEKRLGAAFSLTLLRHLRSLATKEARAKMLPIMTHDAVTKKMFQRGVDDAVEAMWVDWHWSMAPDTHIHPTKSMPQPLAWSPLPLARVLHQTHPLFLPSSAG